MPKIALILSSLAGGGAERVAVNLATDWLADDNNTVYLVTLSADVKDAYDTPSGLNRRRLDLYSNSVGVLQALSNNHQRVQAIRQELKQIDADVVLSFLPEVNVLSILASRKMRHRLVVAERNYAPHESTPIYWRVLRRFCYRWSDVVVTQTEKGASWLTENTSAKSICVIPNIATLPHNAQSHAVAIDRHVEPDEKCILAVGRIHEQKGFDLLIQAFAMAYKTTKSKQKWKLVIAGAQDNKQYAQQLLTLVHTLGLSEQVVFAGRVSNMLDWYKFCRLFVLSSRFEGFPNVLLEAMASGCAVVSTDCDTGPSEIITQASDGLLVEPGNVSALAESIDLLMTNHEMSERLGREAAKIITVFDHKSILTRWNRAMGLS